MFSTFLINNFLPETKSESLGCKGWTSPNKQCKTLTLTVRTLLLFPCTVICSKTVPNSYTQKIIQDVFTVISSISCFSIMLLCRLLFPFLSRWAKARTYVSAEIHRHPAVETDGQADRRSCFRGCVGQVLDIHSSVVPYHCFMITESPHCAPPPLLSPPGSPSVHRGAVCVALLRWPHCGDLQNNSRSILHTLDTILFSKLLILLLCDPLTSFPLF